MRRRVTTSPPLQNTSVDSEFHSTQTCESSAVEYGRHISREVPTIVLTGSLAKAGLARFKRLRQIRSTQWTTIPVLWGELRYSKTTYMVRQPWDVDDDKGFQSKTPVQFESKTTVKFIPYWWTVKMGMNRALEINNQCWKTNLDVYRVCDHQDYFQQSKTFPSQVLTLSTACAEYIDDIRLLSRRELGCCETFARKGRSVNLRYQ